MFYIDNSEIKKITQIVNRKENMVDEGFKCFSMVLKFFLISGT